MANSCWMITVLFQGSSLEKLTAGFVVYVGSVSDILIIYFVQTKPLLYTLNFLWIFVYFFLH